MFGEALKVGTVAKALIPAGLIVAAVGLSVLAAISSELTGEQAIVDAVRDAEAPVLGRISQSLDWLGNRWVIVASVLALSGVLWARGLRREALACLLIIPLELMTLGVREVIDRPRPLVYGEWTSAPPSPGFPSGTALHAMLLFGFMAYVCQVWVRPLRVRVGLHVLLILMIAAVGYSRVYLGVHWPADVVGAWLYGGVFLWVIVVVGVPAIERLWGGNHPHLNLPPSRGKR